MSDAEAVITAKPDGSLPNLIVGFGGSYIETLNFGIDLSRLSVVLAMRADLADTAATAMTVDVRIVGFGTSGGADALYRALTITTESQDFGTTLETWSGNATVFNPTTEAQILHFDDDAAARADPRPNEPVGGDGLRFIMDHVHYREALIA